LNQPIQFVVRAIPVAKARPRAFMLKGRPKFYTPKETQKAESEFLALADQWAPPTPMLGPVRLDLTFVLPIPASKPRWWREAAAAGRIYPITKPDRDNLAKLAQDAFSRSGRWWRDDSQVVAGEVRKVYGEAPETRVEILELVEATREQWTNGSYPEAGSDQPALL